MDRKTKTVTSLLLNRIGWGKSYLKQGGYVDYPEREMAQITPKGIETLSNGILTLKQLKSTPEFLAYCKKRDEQKKSIENDFDNDSPEDLIESGISDIETQVKAELLEKLKSVNPYFSKKLF